MPFSLYPKNAAARLDESLFASPTSEYRGAPFWSWNNKLDLAQLDRQIETMRQMGFGGFNMHSRTGLATEYLGDAYLDAIHHCCERAERDGLLAWLYDEDRWPSGFAGGLLTREPAHRARHLLWTREPYGSPNAVRGTSDYTAPVRQESGTLLGRFDVTLLDGRLSRFRKLADDEAAGGSLWHAYLEVAGPTVWFNGQSYGDTLSEAAMSRFVELTHARFKHAVGRHFGKAVPAIFTDEPQFVKKGAFGRADETRDVFLPWTDDFAATYRQAYGDDLIEHLPELFWNLPADAPSVSRYRYHDHVAERFASAFGDTIARWCEANGVGLTGHMLGEAGLHSQTRGGGEAMRTMRAFHLPGIDVLQDKYEFTTAKQAQSVAHQSGRPGVLSELYGVTGWHFDFVGHKAQGDWQAALGVTVRVPHLAWVSMNGESKRDYPAAIGYQSPWFKEYPLVEDHFARVNAVMTRGVPTTRVAVVHPVESGWLTWGPAEQNAAATARLEEAFEALPRWLLYGLVDFDYLSESNLVTLGAEATSEAALKVGAMRYEAVVVPPMLTIRATTLDLLEAFADAGGRVVFAGEPPTLVDAATSDRAQELAARCIRAAWARDELVAALASLRDVTITHENGAAADSILHNLRADGDDRHLFLVNTDRVAGRRNTTIRVDGRWDVTLRDTHAGTSRPLPTTVADGATTLRHSFPPHGSLLVTLSPTTGRVVEPIESEKWVEGGRLRDPVSVTLSEPNVLLLDRAEWRTDDGEWSPRWDVLRIDNRARWRFGLPLRTGRAVQPWAEVEPASVVCTLQLRFTIESDVDVVAPELALENPTAVRVRFDGVDVPATPIGWWVDEAIERIALPAITRGTHSLEVSIPLTRKTDVEACYLLGDFGVRVAGSHARLIEPVRTLAWGDWTHQGLPFYAGDVTYHATIAGGCPQRVVFPKFANPLLSVALDGTTVGKIAFAPFRVEIDAGVSGERRLDITAFGNRANCFGPLHHADENLKWIGPAAWRSTGAMWQDEYVFKPMGVLAAPILQVVCSVGTVE